MHNCKATQELIVDLVFNEATLDQQASLKSELNQCATCRSEYSSFTATIDTIDGSIETAKPDADFWPVYNERMAARLRQSVQNAHLPAPAPKERLLNKLGQVFFQPVRVPLVIAAMFLLMLGTVTVLALRSQKAVVVNPPVERIVETRNVEVPVIQERVVTRVVYVKKSQPRVREVRPTFIRNQWPNGPEQSESSLAGFRPIDQVKLTVIKGSESNER